MLIMVIIHDVMMPEGIGMMPLATREQCGREELAAERGTHRGASYTLRVECINRVNSNFPYNKTLLRRTWNVSH